MEEKNKEKKSNKKIQIVNGDGSDLNISPVYEHINSDNPPYKQQKKENIVIPKGSSDNKK